MLFLCGVSSLSAGTVPVADTADAPADESIDRLTRDVSSIRISQQHMTRRYRNINSRMARRDSMQAAEISAIKAQITALGDSLGIMRQAVVESDRLNQEKADGLAGNQSQLYILGCILLGLMLLAAVILMVMLVQIRKKIDETAAADGGNLPSAHDAVATDADFQSRQTSGGDNCGTRCDNESLERTLGDFRAIFDQLQRQHDDIAALLAGIQAAPPAEAQTVAFEKPDQMAYNAAVDAWVNINDHLYTLGKDRRKIQHVYAFLAGHDVTDSELQSDLSQLSDDRREALSSIISDIRRFRSIHMPVIEAWLSSDSNRTRTLRDAVRFPLGQGFDNDRDEELTGDSVPNGTAVSMVAALGYHFPGSRSGCYPTKAKVLVEQ